MSVRRLAGAVALGLLLAAAAAPTAAAAADAVRFNRDIRPLLAEHCFHCHGPDPSSRKAKLRFDREDGFFADHGDDGPTVVRGKPDDSPMWQRIVAEDPDDVMPPPKEHKPLAPEQKELLRRWIAQGAPWEPHWSFIAPARPEPPAVRDAAWVREPIDRFVLARLEAAGLTPAPEADRRTLIRRLSLDLTGLPPEPAEVEAFVADAAADAYDRLVDRLLASPRYGEHRARYWLDAARYADTHGMHFDNYREMWAYRDWVIAAFNADQPFDRFTIEQIAGDLLPDATREQRIATGFHRCNPTTNEGGTIEAENLANYARDRVETTAWVWLGLTANCAVCHDHKFDPITQRDFYSMSAYFRNTTQGGLDGNVKDSAPVLALPSPADVARQAAIPAEIDAAKQGAETRRGALRGDFDAWLKALTPAAWDAAIAADGAPDVLLPLDLPEDALAGQVGATRVATRTAEPVVWEEIGGFRAARLDAAADATVDGVVDLDATKPFSYGCWVRIPGSFTGGGSLFSRMDEGDGYRGWDLWVQGNQYAAHLIHQWPADAVKVHTRVDTVKRDQWQHVFATWDGSGKASGFHLYVDGRRVEVDAEVDALKSDALTTAPFKLGRRKNGDILAGAALRDVRVYRRELTPGAIGRIAFAPRIAALLAAAPEARPQAEVDELFALRVGDDPELRAATDRVVALEAEQKAITARSPVTHVQVERGDSAPKANILERGQYDRPKDEVGPAVFGFLQPLPADAPPNRLGLARWLVAAENPLTPRVVVNRLWQELFGIGLVRTAEDFGIMGEAPSHPELLDWLAVELRDGWDVKRVLRRVVLSATYRQAAVATPDKIERDPQNRLLSRGPRYRMDAEMVRDLALAASGLLSPKIGGPSVKPYQPDGVWEAVGMQESDTKHYRRDDGEALYRRSLYSFWKRMAPPASLEVLNAPSRETACVRRERTDTPLQALVTLDDEQFVEAARALAARAIAAGADDAARLDHAALRVLARPLADDERATLGGLLADLRTRYAAAPDQAKALIAVGATPADAKLDPVELAAMTMCCSTILNLDEALNK